MINPTGEWMHKHGYHHWGVGKEGRYWKHRLDGYDPRGETVKHTEVFVSIEAYDKLTTDTQRRRMLYEAILREEERRESGNNTDVDSGGDSVLPESDRAEGGTGVAE